MKINIRASVATIAALGVICVSGCSAAATAAGADKGKLIPTCAWKVQVTYQPDPTDDANGYVVMAMPDGAAPCNSLLSQWSSGSLWDDSYGLSPDATPVAPATALSGKLVCTGDFESDLSVPVVVSVKDDPSSTFQETDNLCEDLTIGSVPMN